MSLVLVTKSATPPTNPYNGQVWIDTTGGAAALKVYNTQTVSWVQYDPLDDDANMQLQIDAHAGLLYGEGVPVPPSVGAYVDGVKATLTPASTPANSELTFTAVSWTKETGEAVSVTILAGDTGTALEVTVDGNDITIQQSEVASTATQIKTAYDAVAAAVALATVAVEGDGSGATDAAVKANLANGTSPTAGKVGTIHIKADGTEAAIKVSEGVWKTWALS